MDTTTALIKYKILKPICILQHTERFLLVSCSQFALRSLKPRHSRVTPMFTNDSIVPDHSSVRVLFVNLSIVQFVKSDRLQRIATDNIFCKVLTKMKYDYIKSHVIKMNAKLRKENFVDA